MILPSTITANAALLYNPAAAPAASSSGGFGFTTAAYAVPAVAGFISKLIECDYQASIAAIQEKSANSLFAIAEGYERDKIYADELFSKGIGDQIEQLAKLELANSQEANRVAVLQEKINQSKETNATAKLDLAKLRSNLNAPRDSYYYG